MADVVSRVAELAVESGFSGVIRVDRSGRESWSAGFGLADRRHGIANDVDTQFAIASGVKGLTALVVARSWPDDRPCSLPVTVSPTATAVTSCWP
jgi:CubicO group peptidase (beta-lactamase class C family)